LKENASRPKGERTGGSVQIIRGEQAKVQLNAGIVGGGKACYNLLQILDKDRLKRLNMKILGVADRNLEAPGLLYAKVLNLFTTADFEDLYKLEGLNLIIELTGSAKVREAVLRTKPPEISLIDHRSARLLWDLVQTEIEKTEQEERSKKKIQVILDSLPHRIMVVNMDMTIDTVNETFLRDLNVTREDILGKHCDEVKHGLDKVSGMTGGAFILGDGLDEVKERGLLNTMKQYVDENGKTRFAVITVAPIYNEKGEIVQILEASRDVTERIRTMTGVT